MIAIISTNRSGSRRLLLASVFATALAVALPTAPVAYAQSEQQIKSDCEAEGGTYATHVAANGNTVSQCCYRTNQGLNTVHHLQCMYYVNGQYDGQAIYDAPGTTESPPPVPPGAVITAPPTVARLP